MNRVLVVGSEAELLVAALIELQEHAQRVAGVMREFPLRCIKMMPEPKSLVGPELKDQFAGGGRSKGEKKRAAKQRRLRGGY